LLPVTSEHNNLPNTTYAHFFVVLYRYTHEFDVNQPCVPTAGFRQQKSGLSGLGFCCSAVFVRNANMGTPTYPAEQQTLKDNSKLRKSFLQALYDTRLGDAVG